MKMILMISKLGYKRSTMNGKDRTNGGSHDFKTLQRYGYIVK